MVEVLRKGNRVILLKFVLDEIFYIISVYAPQAGLSK